MRMIFVAILLADIGFAAGFEFDRRLHRPMHFHVEITCSKTPSESI